MSNTEKLIEIILGLNPKCLSLGAGMMANMIETARLAEIEQNAKKQMPFGGANDFGKLSAERREDKDAQVMPEEFYGQDTLSRWEEAGRD